MKNVYKLLIRNKDNPITNKLLFNILEYMICFRNYAAQEAKKRKFNTWAVLVQPAQLYYRPLRKNY